MKKIEFGSGYFRKGKIGSLPKAMRDQVNVLLEDGVAFKAVGEWLGQRGHAGINAQAVGKWFRGGHRFWLEEQARLAEMKAKREFAYEVARESSGDPMHEAGLDLAAAQLFEIVCDFDVELMKEMLAKDPKRYTGMLLAFERLSRGNMAIQKFKAHVEEQKRKIDFELGLIKPDGAVTPETMRKIKEALNLM
jgi:hypothetical protein